MKTGAISDDIPITKTSRIHPNIATVLLIEAYQIHLNIAIVQLVEAGRIHVNIVAVL